MGSNNRNIKITEWDESRKREGFSGRRSDVTINGKLVGVLIRFRDLGPFSRDMTPWCPMHTYFVSTDWEQTHLGTDLTASEARSACIAHVNTL